MVVVESKYYSANSYLSPQENEKKREKKKNEKRGESVSCRLPLIEDVPQISNCDSKKTQPF